MIGRHGILDIFMDVSHTLKMTIYVVNQLKDDSYIVRDCITYQVFQISQIHQVFDQKHCWTDVAH